MRVDCSASVESICALPMQGSCDPCIDGACVASGHVMSGVGDVFMASKWSSCSGRGSSSRAVSGRKVSVDMFVPQVSLVLITG